MVKKYTEEDMTGLTEEERLAIMEEDDDDDDSTPDDLIEPDDEGTLYEEEEDTDPKAPPKKGEDDDEDDDSDDDSDESDDDDADGEEDDDADDDADGSDDADEGDDVGEEGDQSDADDDDSEDDPAAQLTTRPPEKYEERTKAFQEKNKELEKKVDDLETKLDEVEEKYRDGDIDETELSEQRKAIRLEMRQAQKDLRTNDQEASKLEREAAEFRAVVAVEKDRATREWRKEVVKFLGENKHYAKSAALNAALDAEVKRIGNDAKESKGLTGREILEKADANIREAWGMPAQEADPAKPKPKVPAEKRKAKRRGAPKTLKDIPASTQTETDEGGKFDYIDKISDPVAREKAIAKLKPEEVDEYMRS